MEVNLSTDPASNEQEPGKPIGSSQRDRKSIRLKGYDYSQAGLYFITICTHDRRCLFGEIVGAGSKPALAESAQGITAPTLRTEFEFDGASSKPALGKPTARAGLEPAPTTTGMDHEQMVKNEYGQIVEDTWFDLVNHVFNIKLHEFIVMPNHIHGIIEIHTIHPIANNSGHSLAEVVRQLKTFSAKRINQMRYTPGTSIWQRNYYEHIIRHEAAYLKIAEYIQTNPLKWQDDTYHV